mgnify:CR=1 FL=1
MKCLPPKDLPPLGQRETAELLVSHAPLAALVVESARCRVLAASIGAVPSQTYVIAPGVPPGSADVHHDRGTARTARILVDLSACSSLDESFVDHVLARIVDEVGVPVHRGSCGDDALQRGDWTLVMVPGAAADPTLPLLHAMTRGLPVITSDTTIGAEVLGSMRHGLLATADDVDALVAGLRAEGFIKDRITIDPSMLMSYLAPFVEPAAQERFTFTREWMREQFERVNDPRSEEFTLAMKLNLPTSYLLIHRTWIGAIGLLSQLNASAPFREILEESLPGFAD